MAFKMKHKWQSGMYSGMAADKLKFIQKTGSGKSMAKQTENVISDEDQKGLERTTNLASKEESAEQKQIARKNIAEADAQAKSVGDKAHGEFTPTTESGKARAYVAKLKADTDAASKAFAAGYDAWLKNNPGGTKDQYKSGEGKALIEAWRKSLKKSQNRDNT